MPAFRFRHVPDAVLRAAGLRRNKAAQALALLDDRDRQLEDYLSALPTPPSAASSVVSETAFGQAAAVGTAATFAKGDHTHGTPTNPVSLATSVVSETSFGQAAAVGTSGSVAKADHTHGTPAAPAAVRNFYCEIGRTTVQSVADGGDWPVGFNVTDSTSTVDLRVGSDIVINATGRWLVWVSVKWAALNAASATGGYRSTHIVVNGVAKVDQHTSSPEAAQGGAVAESHNFARALYLTAGDAVRVDVRQQHSVSPGARDLLGGDAISPILGVKLLDP